MEAHLLVMVDPQSAVCVCRKWKCTTNETVPSDIEATLRRQFDAHLANTQEVTA